jgi:hypothetical protein
MEPEDSRHQVRLVPPPLVPFALGEPLRDEVPHLLPGIGVARLTSKPP